jgi:LCP family protein required for cell wall assembly
MIGICRARRFRLIHSFTISVTSSFYAIMPTAILALVHTSMRSNYTRRSPARIRLPLWALGLLIVIFVTIFIGSSVWLFSSIREKVATLEVISPDFSGSITIQRNADEVVPVNGEPSITVAEEPLPILTTDALQPWSGTERVSILLLGIDQRCDEEGPTHTDSMMVVTIDPVGLSAGVLSLPRDLWVEIPNFDNDRVNQAYYLGEVYEYPGGGQVLAVEAVETILGIPIDYYAAVNFNAFVEVVDLIGGIDVTVPETIDDPAYPDQCYGHDPFYIEAGEHHFTGEQALKYARTRATFGGDVDRANRQQAVILAARDQILKLDELPQLLGQAPELWQTSQDNIRTNLTLDEAIQLALLVQEIPRDNIYRAVIDYSYVYNETTPDGREVLVPIRTDIRQLRDQLFAPPAVSTPVVENLPALMAEENARVAVYNGTSVFGLAAATQEYLQNFDINITEIGNADASTYLTSQIITYGSFPNTTRYLTQLMHIPPLNVSNSSNPNSNFDILIIIGDDWRIPGP